VTGPTAESTAAEGPALGRPDRPDLDDPAHVAELVRRFYAEVDRDPLLGPMFNDVARVDWPEHLVKLTAFWCRALFGIAGYQGNPFRAHAAVHGRHPMSLAHFERWLALFSRTLDEGWKGPTADQAKALAVKVARVHSHQLVGREVLTPPADGAAGAGPPGSRPDGGS
jgi:hemoglobin